MSAIDDPAAELTTAELPDLRRLAGFVARASTEYGVREEDPSPGILRDSASSRRGE